MAGKFRYPSQPDESLRPAPRCQPSALVVDDDSVFRTLAQAALEAAGFAVHLVDSGEAALERYDELRPDLVLLDLELPGPDGFAVCAELRERYGAELAPVLWRRG